MAGPGNCKELLDGVGTADWTRLGMTGFLQGNKRYWSEKQNRCWDERLNNTIAINNSYESIVKRNSA